MDPPLLNEILAYSIARRLALKTSGAFTLYIDKTFEKVDNGGDFIFLHFRNDDGMVLVWVYGKVFVLTKRLSET